MKEVTLELGPGRGQNAHTVNTGAVELFFSYKTCIGFWADGSTGPVTCQNQWAQTTGAHLSAIDGGKKKDRLPWAEFQKALKKALSR